MNKKESVPVSSRIDTITNKKLEQISKRTEKTKGEQIRIAIKRFVQISERLQQGESMCWIPCLDIKGYKKVLTDLDELLEVSDDIKLSDETKIIINTIIDSVEWALLSELEKKYPDQEGFFPLR